MSEPVPTKDCTTIGQIIDQLGSLSLLKQDESVLEGCFPVRIRNKLYYCLLTNHQLILSAKKSKFLPQRSFLLPFQKIIDISFGVYRHIITFILLIVAFFLYIIFYPIFTFIPATILLYWVIISILLLITPPAIYYFIRGEPNIQLRLPGKKLNLRRDNKYSLFYGIGNLNFFEFPMDSSEFIMRRGNLQELYDLLLSYFKKL